MIQIIQLILIGITLGLSMVIPGISAGTMAVVFNIYDRLIGVITPNVKKILAQWKFLLPLAIGIGGGVLLFSRVITFLFENYPIPTIWFFIGVIAGSIPLIYNRVRQPSSLLPSIPSAICFVIALAVMILFAVLQPTEGTTVYTELTLSLFGMLFAAGIFSSIAMLVPGISGSFLMLVIGLYLTVMAAISNLHILLLIPFALGIIAGLLGGAAGIRLLLAKAPRQTYGAVLGLVAGSILVLYSRNLNPAVLGTGLTIVFSIVALVGGMALSFFLGKEKPEQG